jgi:hypothetical protein
LLSRGLDREDDRSQLSEEEQGQLLSQEVEAATAATAGNAQRADVAREKALLSEMEKVADHARGLPDARVRYLLDWIRRQMCPGVALPGQPPPQPGAKWADLRLLIFTEYDDTRRCTPHPSKSSPSRFATSPSAPPPSSSRPAASWPMNS